MKNVAVFFGGVSVEHDISVITGVLTLNSLKRNSFIPVPVYIDGNGEWFTGEKLFDVENYKGDRLKKLKRVSLIAGNPSLFEVRKNGKLKKLCVLSCAINCLHGERGEDGSLAGLVNLCALPLASPEMLASSVAIDKSATKIFLKGLNVKTLPCIPVSGIADYEKVEKELGYPVIVKPARLGSSIGISCARDTEELREAVRLALRYGEEAIIEPKLGDFTEINCAVYSGAKGPVVSECERPVTSGDLLSFDDKYSGGAREFPAKIPKAVSDKIKKTAIKIFHALKVKGIIRIDFFVADGEVIVNEINTVPGSLAYYLFAKSLTEFSDILAEEIRIAEKNFAKEQTFRKKYPSAVLNIKGCKSSKRL